MLSELRKYLYETMKHALRSYPFVRPYLEKVERLYAMSPKELTDYKTQRFLEIFNRAYDMSPFYGQLYREAGICKNEITSLSDITKLPIVTKDMVKRHGLEILTVPYWRALAGHTSGTTGTPLTIYENWSSILWEQAYVSHYQKLCGYSTGKPIISLRGNIDKSIVSLTVHASRTLYLSSYNININTAEEYYQKIIVHKPIAIKGYPSSLYALALVFKDKGFRCHIPVAFTSSETLYPHQRKLIEDVLGTDIYDHYGTTERTVSLEESLSHDGYFEAPGYAVVEYRDDCLITTSLINDAFPLIRYKTDDRIVLKSNIYRTNTGLIVSKGNITGGQEGRLRCGAIKQILGRSDDYVVCKDGSMVTRIDFVEESQHICACQWIQTTIGAVEVRIVPDDGFTERDKEFVVNATIRRCGEGNMDVLAKVCALDELEYTSRGKFRLIVNKTKDYKRLIQNQ